MIQRYHNEPVGLRVTPEPGDYLKLHDRILPDGSEQITVGRGGSWSVLACKEVYGKASKAVQASGAKSAVFDLSAAAELGRDGLLAAAEGICGGAYQMKYTLSDQWEPEFACYASGEGWQEQDLQLGWTLAESILRTRSLVNRPANLLTPERLATALTEQCAGLPVETQCYDRGTLHELGLEAFLAVGDSSGHSPVLAVLRYTGAPDSAERLGLVGKGVTVDSGGYNLKSSGSMAGIKGDMAGGAAVAAAFRKGVDAAYKAVMKPTEGTILTVIRKAAEAAEQIAASNNDAWTVCCAAMAAAEEALAKTPEQLPVLKKAGVVDAGGQGLVLIFQGMGAVLEKGTVVQPIAGSAVTPVQAPDKSTVAAASGEIEFGYCSEFLIEKDRHAPQQDPLRLRAYLESIGDCVVVVDDSDIIKVHVHSNCPGDVIQAALKYGQLIHIKIDNMRYQHRNAEEGVKQGDTPPQPTVVQPENDYGFVAVCAGEGLKELFTDIGADTVVSGGQTMNPSTDDILNAIMATPAKTVFVLPNNKNIIMAAEQAIPLAKDRQVRVLQTKTIPQGISAMLVFDETQSADDNQMAMMDAAAHVETGSVTFAARDSELDGRPIKQGDIMGMCGSKIKFLGNDIVDGGQPIYYFLLSVE